jgi:HD-like signal output (HDOD) protein/CheY-like chemotaxis protein
MSRILFVDDEPSVLAGLRRMLRHHRGTWDTSFESDGRAALQSLAARPAAVIVTDFRMPGMDGGSLLGEVRRQFPDTVRLVLSGHTDEKDLLGLTDLAHQFLTKPCSPDELQSVVERVLAARSGLDGLTMRPEVCALGSLPSPRRAVRAVQAAVNVPEPDHRDVARAVAGDVALSAKVLQLVNSSFLAPRARVTSMEDAVTRVGIGTIRTLADRAAADDRTAAARVEGFLERANAHAVATARLARRLADPAVADDAYCAGLLHPVGAAAIRSCQAEAGIDSEGDDMAEHRALGASLLALWGLPSAVTGAIADLDDDDPPTANHCASLAAGDLDVATAVRVAHILAPALPINTTSAALASAAPRSSAPSPG